jgi:hypothetical protein
MLSQGGLCPRRLAGCHAHGLRGRAAQCQNILIPPSTPTTTISTTAASPATTTSATAAATTLFARASFVDGQRAAVNIFLVETIDGSPGLIAIDHFDKPKAFAAPRIAIDDHLGAFDLSELGEHLLQLLVVDVVAEIPNVQTHSHGTFP